MKTCIQTRTTARLGGRRSVAAANGSLALTEQRPPTRWFRGVVGGIGGGAAAFAAILLGAALGGGFHVFTSEGEGVDAPKAAAAQRQWSPSKRLLPREMPSSTDVLSQNPARSAFDFTGPESDGSSAARLSAAEWQAIEAAWRAGDFAGAAQLTTRLEALDDRRLILRPLLTDWVAANPVAAARFAQSRPAGVERSELLETVIRAWSARNVAEASAWLDRLMPEPDHDQAVAAIATCEVLLQRRPEIALSWAESIGAPTLRWEAICTVAQDWARRDPTTAEGYVATSAVLTPDERTQMLAHLRRWTVAVK